MLSRMRSLLMSLIGGRAIGILKNLFVIPILIKIWGLDYYGEWVLVSSITSLLSTTNVGIGTAAQLQIVNLLGKDDKVKSSAIVINSYIIIIFTYAVGILFLLLYNTLFPINFRLLKEGQLIEFILLSTYFANQLSKPLRGYWVFNGQYNVSSNLDNLLSFVELLILVVVPLFDGAGLLIAVVSFLVNLIWTVYYIIISKRKFDVHFNYSVSLIIIRTILGKGLGFQFTAVWQAILFQVPLWVIGFKSSASLVAVWSSLRAFTRFGNQIIEIIALSVGSEFQVLFSKNKLSELTKLFASTIQINLALSVLTFTGIIFFGEILYSEWVQVALPEYNYRVVWFAMGLSLVFFSVWRLCYEIEIANSKPWKVNLFGVFSSIISTLYMYMNINSYGIVALSLGSLIFDVCMAVLVPFLTIRSLKIVSLKNFISFIFSKQSFFNSKAYFNITKN